MSTPGNVDNRELLKQEKFLKYIVRIEGSRHRSFHDFIANSLSASQRTASLKRSPPST